MSTDSNSKTNALLNTAKRVVIKVGSALLVDEAHGTVHRKWLGSLAADIKSMRDNGQEVVLVSSGAIAVGRHYLDVGSGHLKLEEKQAAAAAGQVRLAHAYLEELHSHGLGVGQVLLTLDDTENRRRYLNARNTINALLRLGAVPLINENDTVATDEIRFGDNDRLAARVAAMISADALVLLSDIDGLYSADPATNKNAEHLGEITEITSEIEAMAGAARTDVGSGGMVTKLAAAKICLANGCAMVIAKGDMENPITAITVGNNKVSWFLPKTTPASARKRWIAASLQPNGTLVVDDGALNALKGGKSLLAAGVANIKGDFEKGDAVYIRDSAGNEIARGLSAYSSGDAKKIIGHKSTEFETILGYRGRDEIVHRDDMSILPE
ncbi:MAG: glutamate 5-kinase [Rhodospirillaceae bacterium]|nr:glutamate 5-kinase [Rhodospirillaceae bacterium]